MLHPCPAEENLKEQQFWQKEIYAGKQKQKQQELLATNIKMANKLFFKYIWSRKPANYGGGCLWIAVVFKMPSKWLAVKGALKKLGKNAERENEFFKPVLCVEDVGQILVAEPLSLPQRGQLK